MLKHDLGEDFVIAAIGPAGESMVSFACIGHDFGRQAGRCGFGAVMGSKRLKAIAVRGTGSVPIHDLTGLKDLTMGVIKRTSTHPNMAPWQKYGTAMFVGWSNEHGVYPTHNFQTTYFERYAGIDGQPLVDKLLVSNTSAPTTTAPGRSRWTRTSASPRRRVGSRLSASSARSWRPSRRSGASATSRRRSDVRIFLKAGGVLTDYLKPDIDAHTRQVEAVEGQTLRQILESIGLTPRTRRDSAPPGRT